jgi:hypothetical protein
MLNYKTLHFEILIMLWVILLLFVILITNYVMLRMDLNQTWLYLDVKSTEVY